MASAKEILLKFYEQEGIYISAGGGDFSAMAKLLHRDFVMRQPAPLPFGGDWHGAEGMEAWLDKFGQSWSKLSITGSEIYESGDVVITKVQVAAQARQTGAEIQFEILQYIKVIDRQIAEMRPYYWDLPAILKALNN